MGYKQLELTATDPGPYLVGLIQETAERHYEYPQETIGEILFDLSQGIKFGDLAYFVTARTQDSENLKKLDELVKLSDNKVVSELIFIHADEFNLDEKDLSYLYHYYPNFLTHTAELLRPGNHIVEAVDPIGNGNMILKVSRGNKPDIWVSRRVKAGYNSLIWFDDQRTAVLYAISPDHYMSILTYLEINEASK